MLNQLSHEQQETIKLWFLVQHSLSTFNKLRLHFGSPAEAATLKNLRQWASLPIHKNHIARANEFLSTASSLAFQRCLEQIQQSTDFILLDTDALYPPQLLPYEDRPPLLFGLGNPKNLSQPQIAIVGSRKPSPHGKQVSYDFSYYLAEKGFWITSGLAEGIDEAAHQGAIGFQRTIAVVGTGLDITYPAQHQILQRQIVQQGGTVISEFLPGTPPLQQHFPRRNRIVSGLSLGVIVAEAALKSGSLITAKTAAEQGKHIFAIPGHIYNEFHQGCHQLIREGAVLIDHPEQVIEDLALPTQWLVQEHARLPVEQEVPDHLIRVYQQLDWEGQDLDQLVLKTGKNSAELLSDLMELELLGCCKQSAGLYMRCRLSF